MTELQDQACSNCRFGLDLGDSIECRRNAPGAKVVDHPVEDHFGFVAWWPRVSSADWCGEWLP